jgi:hypothetical protein
MGRGSEQKAGLIKNHVSRDDQAVCGEIKAAIAFVIRRVAKEHTHRVDLGLSLWRVVEEVLG